MIVDGGSKAAEITNKLLYMIAKDNMPFSTVENEGFLTFMKTVVPLYTIPSRRTVTRLLEGKYDLLSSMVKVQLSEIKDVSLTTDIWMDSLNTKSFLGVTSHFILNDEHKSVTIGVTELKERHTSDYITSWLLEITKDWNISKENIIVCVSDNAANMKKGIIDAFGSDKHLPCFAHTLNLVPSKIIENDAVVSSLCKKVKAIVHYFKKSGPAADELRNVTDLKLKQSMEVRWNSTYYMLERFIDLSDKIAPLLLKSPSAPSMLSAIELQTAQELIKLLKPFEEATKILCGESYLTASKVIPVIHTLKIKMERYQVESQSGQQITKLILDEFNKRFAKIEQMPSIAIATILDPRFKKIHFTDKLACSQAINKISKIMNDAVLQGDKTTFPHETMQSNDSNQEDDFWSFHENLANLNRSSKQNVDHSTISEDLSYYLNQPTCHRNQNAIKFWNNYSHSILSKLAKRYLAIIATSVPSERLFSKAGNIVTESRNRLSSDHLQQLLFLNSLSLKEWNLE